MNTRYLLLAVFSIFLIEACNKIMPSEPKPEATLTGPIEELSPQQKANHLRGDAEFGRVFGSVDGLGPIFVASSCESCHAGDGKGHPATTLVRFAKFDGIEWDHMVNQGGPQLQPLSIAGYTGENMPEGITGSTRLVAPAVAGLGYLEAVEDATILALADPDDKDGDGISGIPSYVSAPSYLTIKESYIANKGKYIGRFGKKAGAIDLIQQTANAYLNDMGITSDFNMEDLYNVQNGNFTGDNVADPEVPTSTVHAVAFYMRTVKAPVRRDASNKEVLAGEKIFTQIGCEKCHKAKLITGKSEIDALSNKTFHPYTDLLLHDMGKELDDNYTEGSALSSEWKTVPLWGLGLSKIAQGGKYFLLHDGRAKSIQEAIQYHGGEAQSSRTEFQKLTETEKNQLIKFLESL